MRTLIAALALSMTPIGVVMATSSEASASCGGSGTLHGVELTCIDGENRPPTGSTTPRGSKAGPRIGYLAVCMVRVGNFCGRGAPCNGPDGTTGTLLNVIVDGEIRDQVCRTESAEPPPATIDVADVASEWKRLDWPTPTLVVQPPDGTTLVNLATNAYTPDPGPLTQTTTLLTQQVTIEATPTSYTWDFGDGPPLTTTDPGAPYPALRITHTYRRTGTYNLTLTTTLSGRYRIADGPWQPIPGTLTLTTPAQPLRAVEATPRLVKP